MKKVVSIDRLRFMMQLCGTFSLLHSGSKPNLTKMLG